MMWTRFELKSKAKTAVKRNYVCCILVALVLLFAMGSQDTGTATVSNQNGSDYINEGEIYTQSGEITMDELYLQAEAILSSPAMVMMDKFLLGPMQMVWDVLMKFFGNIPLLLIMIKILVFGPIEVGGCRFFMKNSSGETPGVKEVFFAFKSKDYWNIVFTMFLRDLYVILWSMLFFIPGLIKSYQYRMIPYLLAENSEMNRKEVFVRTREMMYGEKWRSFVLDFSFILWDYLSIFTFGLAGILFVNPYQHATNAELYYALGQRAG
ncbi:MAG: DUF975 family protein [Muricoprocola sp.]